MRKRVQLAFVGERSRSRTKQSFKDECTINKIVAKYRKSGDPRILGLTGTPYFGDFTGVLDYKQSLDFVIEAQNSFNELPAEIKTRFNHNPGALLEYLADDKNADEARELGLLRPLTQEELDARAAAEAAAQSPVEPAKEPV